MELVAKVVLSLLLITIRTAFSLLSKMNRLVKICHHLIITGSYLPGVRPRRMCPNKSPIIFQLSATPADGPTSLRKSKS
uniref:Putative secreted protein n=1 Tax=Xenopsylla cheopis TaxID=163159 RepID=A0A6M2DVD2_XENCH